MTQPMGGRGLTAWQRRAMIAARRDDKETLATLAARFGVSIKTAQRVCRDVEMGGNTVGRPRGFNNTTQEIFDVGEDPLLIALRRVHGNDPRRAHDDVRVSRFSDGPLDSLAGAA